MPTASPASSSSSSALDEAVAAVAAYRAEVAAYFRASTPAEGDASLLRSARLLVAALAACDRAGIDAMEIA